MIKHLLLISIIFVGNTLMHSEIIQGTFKNKGTVTYSNTRSNSLSDSIINQVSEVAILQDSIETELKLTLPVNGQNYDIKIIANNNVTREFEPYLNERYVIIRSDNGVDFNTKQTSRSNNCNERPDFDAYTWVTLEQGSTLYETDNFWGEGSYLGSVYSKISCRDSWGTLQFDGYLGFKINISPQEAIIGWMKIEITQDAITVGHYAYNNEPNVIMMNIQDFDDLTPITENSLFIGSNHLYPNPAKNIINLNSKVKSYQLLSVDGHIIRKEDNINSSIIDVSELSHGHYIIRVNGNHYSFVKE